MPVERSGALLAAGLLAAAAALAQPSAERLAERLATCAACHGANGVSVADAIPNLAGQRGAYLEAQLKALKEGSRKNPVMNAIAAQLGNDEIGHVAAYFASLPGAAAVAKSDFLPALALRRRQSR